MRSIFAAFTGAAALLLPVTSQASSIVSNELIQLGINNQGQLGIPGLVYLPTGNDALLQGCQCEGWGAGDGVTGAVGYVTTESSSENMLDLTFEASDSQAKSTVAVADALEVTHDIHKSASGNLLEIGITIENISKTAIEDVRYTRVIDWDVEPTPTSEVLSLGGVSAAAALLRVSLDPRGNPNPFGPREAAATGLERTDRPGDLGTTFDFSFGSLAPGKRLSFSMFYGAAANRSEAMGALSSVLAEVYAIAQAGCDPDAGGTGCDAPANAFIVGFSGVGGQAVSAGDVPLPGAIVLLLSGLFGLGTAARKKTRLPDPIS